MNHKHIILLLFLLLMPLIASAETPLPDSLQLKALDVKLKEYFSVMEREELEVQKQECDFVIGSAEDADLRGIIAEKVYDHFMTSRRMGSEGISVHVYDKWFSDGALKMSDDLKQMNARIYADFNRESLLGCKAPDLKMQTSQGDSLVVFPSNDNRYKILYFYDVDCSKCKVQTILIRNLLATKNYPVDFYAVYVGDNKLSWDRYAADHLNVSASATRTYHLWDADLSSDFQRKYGVTQSPRLFLVNPAGVITGRGLDTDALAQMLENALSEKTLEYGSEASKELYDIVFADEALPSVEPVKSLVDHVAVSTLAQADTVLHRQMTGDLMYYLSSKTGEGYKEGLHYLIDEYILSQPKIWRTQDDTLKIVGMAQILDDLLSKGEPGSEMPPVKVSGELQTWKRTKHTQLSLNRLPGQRNIVIFYTNGCSICAAQKKAASELLSLSRDKKLSAGERKSIKKIVVFLVNVDEILSNDSDLARTLFDAFDLSVLPFLVESDARGIISRRYVSLTGN
jgi:peroxiredoxin